MRTFSIFRFSFPIRNSVLEVNLYFNSSSCPRTHPAMHPCVVLQEGFYSFSYFERTCKSEPNNFHFLMSRHPVWNEIVFSIVAIELKISIFNSFNCVSLEDLVSSFCLLRSMLFCLLHHLHQVDVNPFRFLLFLSPTAEKIFPVCQEKIFHTAPNRLKKYVYKKLNIVKWIMLQATYNGILDGNSLEL